jgi:hypothetical protein
MSELEELGFGLGHSPPHGCLRIRREVVVSNNHLVKLISQEICTSLTTVAIVYCKKWAARPVVNSFELRFYNVQNDRHSVLIVVPNHSLVGVCGVSDHYAILLTCVLGCIVVLLKSSNLVILHLLVLFRLFICHLHASVDHDGVRVILLTLWLVLNVDEHWFRLFFRSYLYCLSSSYESLISVSLSGIFRIFVAFSGL